MKAYDGIMECNEFFLRKGRGLLQRMGSGGKERSESNPQNYQEAKDLHPASFSAGKGKIIPVQPPEHIMFLKVYNSNPIQKYNGNGDRGDKPYQEQEIPARILLSGFLHWRVLP